MNSSLFRFMVVGIFSTAINFLTFYYFYYYAGLNTSISYSLGYFFGVFLGLFLNKNWTFGDKNKLRASTVFYYSLVYILSYFLGLLLFNYIEKKVIIEESIIEIFTIAFTALINYLGLKYFVFINYNTIHNKFFFKKEFFPKHSENRMKSEGDTRTARDNFIKNRFKNVDFLLRKRYEWMNTELKTTQKIIEVGAGAGFSKLYLNESIILTDAVKSPWIDLVVDATNMPFENDSVDVIIASHTIHHFYSPMKFFLECQRVLKPGGKILISEIYTSLSLRTLLKIMKHEGYSYNVNVFSEESICNDPDDCWSANCAIPELLFKNTDEFHSNFKKLTVRNKRYSEFLVFPLSGGVISKIKIPRISFNLLKLIDLLDKLLISFSKSTFAMGINLIIIKK